MLVRAAEETAGVELVPHWAGDPQPGDANRRSTKDRLFRRAAGAGGWGVGVFALWPHSGTRTTTTTLVTARNANAGSSAKRACWSPTPPEHLPVVRVLRVARAHRHREPLDFAQDSNQGGHGDV